MENETTAVAVQEPVRMLQPAAAYDFAPKDLEQAMTLADMLAKSSMVPKDFKGQPGSCLIAMQWGAELGLKPLQAIQNIAVINGKPGLYGDIGKALLLGRGFKVEEDDVELIKGSGIARCKITRPNGDTVTRTFSVQNAKDAGLWKESGDAVWFKYRYRQMAWRAFWFAARDAAADVLKGMGGVEELRDYTPEKDVTTEGSHETAPPAQSKSAKVADELKNKAVKVLSVAEVVKAFEDAKDPDAINKIVGQAARTGAAGSEADKTTMSKAYHDAVERYRKTQAPAAPTLPEVRQKLAAATTQDEADLAASLIDGLECEPDIKEALKADYKAIRESLVAKE